MADRKVGELLDSLGVTAELAEGDMVSDAVVLLKVVPEGGPVAVCIAQSEGLSWLDQLGLVTAAAEIIKQTSYEPPDEG